MRQMVVAFEGEGSGTAEMTWGQLEIWGAMQRQRTKMPLPVMHPLPPGTTLDDIADWLRYLMGRHQAMRTRLHPRSDGPPYQVLSSSGEIAVNVIEAGGEDPVTVLDRFLAWRDLWIEREYDFSRDWPVFLAVILKDGVPTHRLITLMHVVMDAFGGLAMFTDFKAREAGHPVLPVTAMQPLDQARWQRSPEGQRHNEAVLRHWADLLRQIPARRFPPPVDRGQPRYWHVAFYSPAVRLAVQVIRARTRTASAQIVLTLFLVALARVTGINPVATRVAVNNRFRRGLADSVSIITQYGLCVLDVAGLTFDEALARLGRKVLAAFKNAYYDPPRLAELVEQVSRERGEEVDVHCYYNDRRLGGEPDTATDPVPSAAEVLAARPLTTIRNEPLARAAERMFVAVEEAPGTFRLTLESDTRYLSHEDLTACAHLIEELAVEAALNPAAPTGVPGPARD